MIPNRMIGGRLFRGGMVRGQWRPVPRFQGPFMRGRVMRPMAPFRMDPRKSKSLFMKSQIEKRNRKSGTEASGGEKRSPPTIQSKTEVNVSGPSISPASTLVGAHESNVSICSFSSKTFKSPSQEASEKFHINHSEKHETETPANAEFTVISSSKDQTSPSKIKCKYCTRVFATMKDLDRHEFKDHYAEFCKKMYE